MTGLTYKESAYPSQDHGPIARVTEVIRAVTPFDDKIVDLTVVHTAAIK